MANKKIVHIARLDKFLSPFIDLIERHTAFEDHLFFLRGDEERYPIKLRKNIFLGRSTNWHKPSKEFLSSANQADKIILHGLFDPRIIFLLLIQPWLLSKCYWVIWGGDLYGYQSTQRSWRWLILESLRKQLIRRVGHLVTYVDGDIEIARNRHKCKGQYHRCIMYPSNLFQEVGESTQHRGINIQVGNSADPTNNHLEVFKLLQSFRAQEFAVFVPLSYGDDEYGRATARHGHQLLGDKFHAMTDFMPFSRYLDYLRNIDIVIFNHRRQQGMGNAITLLGMGKTLYMRSDVASWGVFESMGVKILDVKNCELQMLPVNVRESNSKLIKERFSESALVREWNDIFNSHP